MDRYRIRRGVTESEVGDVAALLALAKAGKVRASDEIEHGAGWVRADRVPELRGQLRDGDPWAAWSDVEEVDAATLYRRMVEKEEEPVDLPADAVVPVAEPAPVAPKPRAPEAASVGSPKAPASPDTPHVRPVEAPRQAQARGPVPEDGGELIDFPRARPPAREPLPIAPRRPRTTPPLVRTSRVVSMVIAGLLVLSLGYAWITMMAHSRAGVTPPPPEPKQAATPDPASPLRAIEATLRANLPPLPRGVSKPGDLSDALLLELVQEQVQVEKADGRVTKWVGRRLDEPKTAEVRIQYRTTGDFSREMAAIALVVGRYKRLYRLDMPVLEVTETSTQGMTRIDPEKAEGFYQARVTIDELLGSIAGK